MTLSGLNATREGCRYARVTRGEVKENGKEGLVVWDDRGGDPPGAGLEDTFVSTLAFSSSCWPPTMSAQRLLLLLSTDAGATGHLLPL